MAFNNTVVARAAAGIWGLKLGYATTQYVLAQTNAGETLPNIINGAFNQSYAATSNSAVADVVVANLGLTGTAATDGKAYLLAQLTGVATNARGAVIASVIDAFSGLTADVTYGAAALAFNAKVAAAAVYSSTVGTVDAAVVSVASGTSFNLGTSQDSVTGTAGADLFSAYIFDNSNTLQSGDFIDGGAGADTLYADMGSSANFAVTPITRGVETVQIRAQSRAQDTGDNNLANEGRVIIDAERMAGDNRWESNNSRADLIVEDVRIADGQITKDITIAFVQSDPGNVDFGVYFDQASLRANSTSSSTLTLQVLDTKSAAEGKDPLLESPYDGVSFSLNGALVVLQDATINNATTYAGLLTAIQGRLAANTATNGIVTAALGATFTVTDPVTGSSVTGTSIVLSATGAVFGLGNWLASQGVPAASNFYTNQSTVPQTTQDLVTSTVILDDVGRGSNGGDLVIGGLSVGETSTSRGVDRFEITVERTSRLQNIDSTNNFLKEVTVKNGTTAGNLTVLGNYSDASVVTGTASTPAQQSSLPGAVSQHDAFGFNDVRLIDASAMAGSITFDATVTDASFAKYILLADTQAAPNGDNTSVPAKTTQVADFIYSGGAGADSITVQVDAGIAASNSNIQVGREDFTFKINGGAGNDQINLRIVDSGLTGNAQNWYGHQKALRNVTIDSGTGDDTVRTPGAGDVIIGTGDGNDTIYVDNTGALAVAGATALTSSTSYNPYATNGGQFAVWALNTDNSVAGAATVAARQQGDLKSDANNTNNLYKAKVTVDFMGLTKTVTLPSTTFTPTDLFINQAIKAAINDDVVLSKLLVAVDGPAYSLVVKSLIDGAMAAGDLKVTIAAATAAEFSVSELASVAAAYNLVAPATTAADVQAVFTTALATFNTNADYGASTLAAGVSVTQAAEFAVAGAGPTAVIGAASVTTSDNTVTPGAGNDVIVLGTTDDGTTALGSSNDVVVYAAGFGNDTIVNFTVNAAGVFGGDQFNFAALGGRAAGGLVNGVGTGGKAAALAADRSIVIDETITTSTGAGATDGNTTLLAVAAYFNDSGNTTAAETHVVVVVNTTTNVGTVYAVTDAVGGTAGAAVGVTGNNVTAVLAGTIDLADTQWSTIIVGNFT